MTKKICFFNSSKTWGGGEKWHLDIAVRLKAKGYKVTAFAYGEGELAKRLIDRGIKVHKIKISNLTFLNIFKVSRISRILKNENINTIILNLSSDMKAGGIAARKAKVEKIIYRRGSAIPVRNTTLNRHLFRNVITHIIANSGETKNTILQNNPGLFPEEKIKVIYNGIDIEKFDSQKSTAFDIPDRKGIILGNAGRMVEQKAQKYLIEIARELKNRKIPFKLLIAGQGRLFNELKDHTKNHGVEQDVVFSGFVEDIKGFMSSIDIFLLTSLWEGFGYAIVEAMAMRKPVIAFNVSSNPEIITDGETGFLVNDLDIRKFAEKIEILYKNKDQRTVMGEKGRKKVEDMFSITKTIEEVENVI